MNSSDDEYLKIKLVSRMHFVWRATMCDREKICTWYCTFQISRASYYGRVEVRRSAFWSGKASFLFVHSHSYKTYLKYFKGVEAWPTVLHEHEPVPSKQLAGSPWERWRFSVALQIWIEESCASWLSREAFFSRLTMNQFHDAHVSFACA